MTLIKNSPEAGRKIDQVSKRYYGTITSTLAKHLGIENLIVIDDLVAKSFKQAKSYWSHKTAQYDTKNTIWQFITDNSSDLFCTKVKYRSSAEIIKGEHLSRLNYPDNNEATSNNIAMMFFCCHKSIALNTRMALILKILGGYTSSDIARALSKNETSVLNEINKAKTYIISSNAPFDIPGKYTIDEKLNKILESLFSIFELGFNHPKDRSKILPQFCYTAINLLQFLTSHPKTNCPKSRALLAYMLLCASRIDAMKDKYGNTLNLKEQDRSLWNSEMIKKGIEHLYSSADGREVSIYHLKAGVAAVHSTCSNYKLTDWKQIISLYDRYLEINHSTLIELERAIAVSKCRGPEEGLKLINNIHNTGEIEHKALLSLTLSNLNLQLHKYKEASKHFKKAADISENSFEQAYIFSKIHICEQRIKMARRYEHSRAF